MVGPSTLEDDRLRDLKKGDLGSKAKAKINIHRIDEKENTLDKINETALIRCPMQWRAGF